MKLTLSGGLSGETGRSIGVRGIPLRLGLGGLSGDLVGSGSDGGLVSGFSLNLLGVSVEEQIGKNVPGVGTSTDGSPQSENFSAEQVPNETNGVSGLVVGGDGNVDELQGSIGVTQSDNAEGTARKLLGHISDSVFYSRDVNVCGLSDGLVVNSGVGDDDDSGFLERSGDVVGQVTGGTVGTRMTRVSAFRLPSFVPNIAPRTIDQQWRWHR